MEFNATFIVAIISFIIFMLIMNKILYKPVSRAVEVRENLINGNYNVANSSREKISQIYANRDERLRKNAEENKKHTAEKLAEANLQAKNKTNAAKENSVLQINDAKNDIHQRSQSLENELQGRIDELSNQISAKILGE